MAYQTLQEGTVQFTVSSIDTPCHTYYKIVGNLKSKIVPVIVLHGGPGSGHDYCLPFGKLWSLYGIPVVFYDQIGCAKSTHLREKASDKSFWKVDLFIAELNNLLDHLGLRDGPYHLLGHSWGGMFASAFAGRQPPGLRRLVIASSPATSQLFVDSVWELTKTMSTESQKAIDEALQADSFDSPAYLAAADEFMRKYLCRGEPYPPEELALDFKNQLEDGTVREVLVGRSPWLYNGILKDWNSIPWLPKITAPTLVYNGEFDTAQYGAVVPFFDHIPRVRWVTIPGASHMGHLDSAELQEKHLKLVGDFFESETALKS